MLSPLGGEGELNNSLGYVKVSSQRFMNKILTKIVSLCSILEVLHTALFIVIFLMKILTYLGFI